MSNHKKFNRDDFLQQLNERLKEVSRAPNIKKYCPHEKQFLFHKSIKKRKLYIGGNRSGKTTGGVCEGIWRATGTHPYRPDLNLIGPTNGRVVGVDFNQGIDKILIPQYKQWCYPSALKGGSWENAYDKGPRTLHFANGSTIEFMSYDQDLDKFAGTSRHWIHFDEEPPHHIWKECLARLIDTDGDYWITMTPVEGMTWIYDELYEENVGNAEGNVLVIEINTLENPFLKAEAIQNFIGSVDDDDVATRIGGAFVQQGGKIYKNFDPTPGKNQVLDLEIDNPAKMFPKRDWTWIIALDHGLKNPTAVLWMAVNRDGFIVVFDEHYRNELDIQQHSEFINRKIAEHGASPDLWVGDPSIINRNAVSMSSVLDEYQKYGLSWMGGNNDVRSGIIRVKRYFNPAKVINPRYDHPLFLRELSLNADSTKPREFARLRITRNCVETIKEARKYRWKTYANKKLEYENNSQDIPHKKDDHAMDALRYAIMTQPDLVGGEETMSELGQSVNDALDKISFANELERADPNNLLDPYNNWTLNNDIPQTDNGWDLDEHMGGVW